MDRPRWRCADEFPDASGGWASLYPLLFMRVCGEKRVRDHCRTALPTTPVLVSSPETDGRFLPPIFVEPCRLQSRLLRDTRVVVYMAMFATLSATMLFHLAMGLHGALVGLIVFGLVAAYAAFNDHLFRSVPGAITERWMFYAWCFAQGPGAAYGFLGCMLGLGAVQLVVSHALGSAEEYKLATGVIYAELAASGEWWRLVSAPLVHDGLAHWATNTLVGTGVLLVYGPVLGARCLSVIALAAPLSLALVLVISQMGAFEGKGIIGISGGIAGLMGCMLVANLRHPESFPRHFAVVTAFVAASTLFTVSLVLSHASLTAHLGGFLVGAVFGWVSDPVAGCFHVSHERDRGPVPEGAGMGVDLSCADKEIRHDKGS